MSEIKVGDKVRLAKRLEHDPEREGTVIQIVGRHFPVYVVKFDHYTDTYAAKDLEVVRADPKFKKGDRVRVLAGEGTGEIGTVDRVVEAVEINGPNTFTYFISLGGLWGRQCVEEGLELVEFLDKKPEPKIGQEIEFDQIRAGDRILTVREFEDGFTLTMEGVAHHQRRDGAWVTSVGSRSVAPKEKGPLAVKQHHILKGREEDKSWFVFSRTIGGGSISVQTLVGTTEAEAKETAKEWNDSQKPVGGFRTVYWAAKAGK